MKTVTHLGFQTLLRWLLGLLLVWAAVSHLANPVETLGSVYAYQLALPKLSLKLAAMVLPWCELICGLMLLANVWIDSALIATTALMSLFLVVSGQAWARGLNISCGCFNLSFLGINETNPNLIKFVESVGFAFCRNLLLVGVCVFLLKKRRPDTKAYVPAQLEGLDVPETLTPAMLHKLRKQQKRATSTR